MYSFGEFSFDADEKILRRGGEILPLPPKATDVLFMLIRQQGKIVSKNELMETIWADSFVEESNLTQSIYTLRRILGTDANGAQFIETVPRRGYRFRYSPETIRPARSDVSNPAESEGPGGYELQIGNGEKSEKLRFESGEAGQTVEDGSGEEMENRKINRPPAVYNLQAKLGFFLPLGLLVPVIIAAVYFYLSKPVPPAPIENVSLQKLTFSGDVLFPVISPDGKSLAFVREDGIYLQDIATGTGFRLNITDHGIFGNLQFSAGGETLFFRDEQRTDAPGNIFQVSRFGGEARKIIENSWSGVGISPDGKQFAFIRFYSAPGEWALIIKNAETGEERKMLSRVQPSSIYRSGFPAWSADGRKISLVEQTANQKNSSRLMMVEAGTGETETIETPRLLQIEQTAWLPGGTNLLVTGRENNRFFQLWKMRYPGGELQRITNDLSIYRNLSVSADGKNLLSRQQSIYSHIWTAPTEDLTNQKQITFGNLNRDGTTGLGWTTDAQNIIYSSRVTGNVDIWTLRPADGVRRQLTENAGSNNENLFITNDARFVYFESTRSGSRHIWRMDANGANPVQVTFSEKETESHPIVSPDGNFLYYFQKGGNTGALWRKNLTDGKAEAVNETGRISPDSFLALSPDGRFLAFNNLFDKNELAAKTIQIGIISVAEKSQPRFFNIMATSSKICWTADGTAFDYVENTAEEARIWRKNLEGDAPPVVILSLPKTFIYDFAWSRDGKNIALARGKLESDAVLMRNFE